ncbi:MAG: hypothetical protein FLDDKLPJ_02664 [Phycisphaerae bacterium]|nr:hypothetical protein [Phycisphaerae bacterium]
MFALRRYRGGGERVSRGRCEQRCGLVRRRLRLARGREDDVLSVTLAYGTNPCGTINSRGKGKAKFNNRPPGDSGVASAKWGCGAVDEKDYVCP